MIEVWKGFRGSRQESSNKIAVKQRGENAGDDEDDLNVPICLPIMSSHLNLQSAYLRHLRELALAAMQEVVGQTQAAAALRVQSQSWVEGQQAMKRN